MNRIYIFLILVAAFFISQGADAQIDIKQKTKDKTINRADQRTDEGIDKGLDAVEDGVKSLFKKKEKKPASEAKQEEEQNTEEKSEEVTEKQTATAEVATPLKSATKYDFIPGDKVLMFEDFSQDEIGDFPALWTTNGSGEVRTLNNYPGKWLYMNSTDNVYCLMKNLTLPDNYIIEFDVVPTGKDPNFQDCGFYLTLFGSNESEFLQNGLVPGVSGFHVTMNHDGWSASGFADGSYTVDGNTDIAPIDKDKLNHVIIWVQKRRLRIYHKGQKAMDLPTLIPDQNKFNRLRFSLWSMGGLPFITNIRLTTAKPDMRSKLLTEGKIISYGIYFDVNSDKVKAESYGTLKEISQVLTENPAVRIKIVGHTDADGDAAKNLDLSKRRAASVKNEIVSNFGIDGSRIETDGKGKNEPVAPNDTPANKAQNRRVEFIKL